MPSHSVCQLLGSFHIPEEAQGHQADTLQLYLQKQRTQFKAWPPEASSRAFTVGTFCYPSGLFASLTWRLAIHKATDS